MWVRFPFCSFSKRRRRKKKKKPTTVVAMEGGAKERPWRRRSEKALRPDQICGARICSVRPRPGGSDSTVAEVES
jgi:hypothetical protein